MAPVRGYLYSCGVDKRNWITVVNQFLDGDAYNWFLQEEKRGNMVSWDRFTAGITEYFVPDNEVYLAWTSGGVSCRATANSKSISTNTAS